MHEISRHAFARAGLLGNPSDGYGGRTIAFTFTEFSASARFEDAEEVLLCPGTDSELRAPSPAQLPPSRDRDIPDGANLLLAAWRRFEGHCEQHHHEHIAGCRGFRLGFHSTIPRQVGLSGSSAIIIAALRCLATRFEVPLPPITLSRLALEAETRELGLSAGPMDRLVQSFGGVIFMDHAPSPNQVERLERSLLPPLFIAWDPQPGESSGRIHSEVKARWQAGDPAVRQAMQRFAGLAELGRASLRSGERRALADLLDQNFDLRASFWSLREVDHQLVEIGRRVGAGVKFAGSGGAVVGLLHHEQDWPKLRRAYREAGLDVIRPTLGEAS